MTATACGAGGNRATVRQRKRKGVFRDSKEEGKAWEGLKEKKDCGCAQGWCDREDAKWAAEELEAGFFCCYLFQGEPSEYFLLSKY